MWWRKHKSRAHSPTRKVMLFISWQCRDWNPGPCACKTRVLPLGHTLPFLIRLGYYHKCVCSVGCNTVPIAQWKSFLPIHGYMHHNGRWFFLLPFWFFILFHSGGINMLSSLIPSNQSPRHNSFSMMLWKLSRPWLWDAVHAQWHYCTPSLQTSGEARFIPILYFLSILARFLDPCP